MDIQPMLAAALEEEKLMKLWGHPNLICEEKLDGSRYILQFDKNGHPKLTSRRTSVKTGKLVDKTHNLMGFITFASYELRNSVVDGEICGGNSFENTVSVMGSSPDNAQEILKAGMKIRYHVFDILYYKGKDLRGCPLVTRKAYLKQLINELPPKIRKNWVYLEPIENSKKSFDRIVKQGGEGVVLKRLSSLYAEGKRNKDWIKVKKFSTYDAIIIGYHPGTGKYKSLFGALLVGQYVDSKLQEVARVSGMTDEQRTTIWKNKDKFLGTVIEFKAQNPTKAKRYRHPEFLRFRNDKNPKDCTF
jgi:bifunctional non-homologous end joining protein LigD